MKKIVFAVLLCLAAWVVAVGQIYKPVRWSFEADSTENEVVVRLTASIDEGWHLYDVNTPDDGPQATRVEFEELLGLRLGSQPRVIGKPITKFDSNFDMDMTYYEKSMVIEQRLARNGEEKAALKGCVTYNVCNGDNCLSNNRYEFSYNPSATALPQENAEPDNGLHLIDFGSLPEVLPEQLWEPVELPAGGDVPQRGLSLWWIFLMGLLGGFVALFTPCVWPVIPMTISFFMHRGDGSGARRDAWLYGLSIVLIYVGLGLLITVIFGASALNNLATNAFFNLLFFALLVVFALSFFGAFEIVLPSSWSNKFDSKANSAAGFASILFMAFTLVLVSFSCTGPIIGTLLVEAATDGGLLAPAVGMLGFALALSLPFSLCALFPKTAGKLPRSGQWMQQLKVCLGFLELAFSLKFLSVADLAYGWGLLSRPMFLSLWFAIFLLMGLYLLRIVRLKSDGDGGERPGTTGLVLGLASIAFAVYMLPGLWGAPVNAVSAFAPPATQQDFSVRERVSVNLDDYDEAMKLSEKLGKPVVIDFSGYGCVNCREMESKVLADRRVRQRLEQDYIVVTLMVDDRRELDAPMTVTENGKELTLKTRGDKWSYLQRHRFGANAQPFYVIQDKHGKPLAWPLGFTTDAERFLGWLDGAK